MRDGRGLRGLSMRECGEYGRGVPRGLVQEHGTQVLRRVEERQDEPALPHPVHRHVDVVAAARGVQAAGGFLSARGGEQPLDEKEQVLARAVVGRAANVVLRNRCERLAEHPSVGRRDDAAGGQHHEVGVMDGEQWRQEQRLRILEVLVENLRDVLRMKHHPAGV